jgi:hypothetical protein
VQLMVAAIWQRSFYYLRHCKAGLYALHTIALRDLYEFLDVISSTWISNAV